MAREAWPNALNAQLFNSKVGVYFRGGLFPWGFISYLKRSGFFSEGFLSVLGLAHIINPWFKYFAKVSFKFNFLNI